MNAGLYAGLYAGLFRVVSHHSQVHGHCHSSITKYMSIMPVLRETAIETAINASL